MSRLHLFVVIVVAVSVGGRSASTQSPASVLGDVWTRAQAGELVDVIVGVESTFAPEGRMRSLTEITAQRAIVAREVETVRARVAAAGVVVGDRFDVIPFFRARVDARSLAELAATRGVTSVEINRPNTIVAADTVPFVNAPRAWAAGATGAGWKVALLDTGVDSTHPFLAGKVVSEACYSGGGADSTSVCPGGAAASTAAGSAAPCTFGTSCSHGSSVAGVAVGINGPGGMTGTAPGASLVAIQVASSGNSTAVCGARPVPCPIPWDADVISGLVRVATVAGAGNTGQVAAVNLSLAGGIRYSSQTACDAGNPAMKAAIDNLLSLGVAVVAGSGNDGVTGELPSPACLSGVVSVGASSAAVPVEVVEFSNDAPYLTLLAPGWDVTTATLGGGFATNSGTSLAVPHVAGAWAVLKHAAPSASPTAVLAALTSTGTPLAHWRSGLVHPLINVDAARLQLLGTSGAAPGAVTGLSVSAVGNALTLAWTAPSSGGAPGSYTLLARLAHGGPVVASLPLGNVTSFSIAAPNGFYVVSVQASNAAGAGAESNPVGVTFPGLPLLPHRPTSLLASLAGSTLTLLWTAPSTGGPIGNYLLQAGPDTSGTWPVQVPLPAGSTTLTFPGVPPGTWYARVVGQNASGDSTGSNVVTFSVSGQALPGLPTLNAATVVNRTVTLSWTAGSGGAPTSYRLAASLSPGGPAIATVPVTANAVSFSNVPPGAYYVRVTALNALGEGTPSNEVTVVVS